MSITRLLRQASRRKYLTIHAISMVKYARNRGMILTGGKEVSTMRGFMNVFGKALVTTAIVLVVVAIANRVPFTRNLVQMAIA